VNKKAKKLSALALAPGYQAELTGTLSLHHTAMTIRKTEGLLAVGIRTNLAFLDSGGYFSASHYEVTGSEPVHFLCDLLEINW
jgi:hypothetical protein